MSPKIHPLFAAHLAPWKLTTAEESFYPTTYKNRLVSDFRTGFEARRDTCCVQFKPAVVVFCSLTQVPWSGRNKLSYCSLTQSGALCPSREEKKVLHRERTDANMSTALYAYRA